MPDTELPTPVWMIKGGPAAIFDDERGRGAGRARFTTIAKVQKLHVITADGAKFSRLRNLESIAKRRSFDSPDVLCAVDDPRVIAATKSAEARTVVLGLSTLLSKLRLFSDDPAALLADVEQIRDAATDVHTRLVRIIES